MSKLLRLGFLFLFLIYFSEKVFALGFTESDYIVRKNLYSFSSEGFSFGLSTKRREDIFNKEEELFFLKNIRFGYTTKNFLEGKTFYSEANLLQKTFEKRIDPYQKNNIHGFLFSKDKENSSFQILFPLIPYVRFGDEKTSIRFIQFGKRTLALYEFKF